MLKGRQTEQNILDKLEQAGVPKRYRSISLEEHYPGLNLDMDVGYYLFGPVGCGKTRLASAITRQHVQLNRFPMFVEVVDFMFTIKNLMANKVEGFSSVDYLVSRCMEAEVLVLDDIVRARPTPWVVETLYRILNDRYNNEMLTVVTSNMHIDDLGDGLGEAISSRLRQMCLLVQLESKDLRFAAQEGGAHV